LTFPENISKSEVLIGSFRGAFSTSNGADCTEPSDQGAVERLTASGDEPMIEIQGTASYVRNSDALPAGDDEKALLETLQHVSETNPPEASLRIWELLETPQTVETICRVLRNEFDLPPAASVEGVRIVLAELYREDLIQLSPDT
jgi:Coenzyme PQQ synthesis protein D (PqqD)